MRFFISVERTFEPTTDNLGESLEITELSPCVAVEQEIEV